MQALSSTSIELVNCVKTHSTEFNKDFFKDHIEINPSALHYEFNDFEIMQLEYIDEEMVSCALFKTIDSNLCARPSFNNNWFYSIYKRKKKF